MQASLLEMGIVNIKGKLALVTGASRGIGRAIYKGFMDEGATVIGISRSRPKDLDQNDTGYIEGDIRETDTILKSILVSLRGRSVDILVNAAGITIDSTDMVEVRRCIDTNALAAYGLIKGLRQEFSAGASIINVTSISAHRGFPNNPGYAMAKAALSHLTLSLANDWAGSGVRFNNLVPGYIRTDMTKLSWESRERRSRITANTVMGRWGEPEDLVGPAIFLASDTSAYMTGQNLVVDGGWLSKGMV